MKRECFGQPSIICGDNGVNFLFIKMTARILNNLVASHMIGQGSLLPTDPGAVIISFLTASILVHTCPILDNIEK